VRCVPKPGDRRQSLISITEKGANEASRAARVARKTNEAIKEGFSPAEIETFTRILSSFFEKFK